MKYTGHSFRLNSVLAALTLLTALPALAAADKVEPLRFYVSPNGSDKADGSVAKPFKTLAYAQSAVREALKHVAHRRAIEILLADGTYYLCQPLIFTSEDSATREAPVAWRAIEGAHPILSGAIPLKLKWEPYRNGILRAMIEPSSCEIDGGPRNQFSDGQLFVNGVPQILARYPNYDPSIVNYGGYAADALSPERVKRWSHPETAILHALHEAAWGDLHYRVTGVDKSGNAILDGGWQNNRSSNPHKQIRFVENVLEELDSPGEWFFDRANWTLYYMPPAGLDLSKARVEVGYLDSVVEFYASQNEPVRFIALEGLSFRHTNRTFLKHYWPLLRSDWSIYRGGAVAMEGAEDCAIRDCDFETLGGNALFLSGYNRRVEISGSRFTNIGASGVCFVGYPSAVRSPTYWNKPPNWATVDKTPGPKTDDYPADCRIEDCLMHHLGTVEKQVAGVQISMSMRITVRHCSIYDVPRAGINIGEGTWGGHSIEYCDVFDTVRETGDHGSFNSWGRDRYWGIQGESLDKLVAEHPKFPEWDAVEPVTIRNSRWRCDRGWDIDLDDGSTNYRIINNLCLHGGIKNREGFDRVVENNIMVDNTFHPHVWYKNSRDAFRHNIVFREYAPAAMQHWDGDLDYNFFVDPRALDAVRKKYYTDAHSTAGDPKFIDPARGDYRVKDDSPALAIGFTNFPMDQFGVVSKRLKAEAKTPQLTNGIHGAAGGGT